VGALANGLKFDGPSGGMWKWWVWTATEVIVGGNCGWGWPPASRTDRDAGWALVSSPIKASIYKALGGNCTPKACRLSFLISDVKNKATSHRWGR